MSVTLEQQARHTRTHTITRAHACKYIHMHVSTHTCTHTQKRIYTHTHTHMIQISVGYCTITLIYNLYTMCIRLDCIRVHQENITGMCQPCIETTSQRFFLQQWDDNSNVGDRDEDPVHDNNNNNLKLDKHCQFITQNYDIILTMNHQLHGLHKLFTSSRFILELW